MPSLDRNAGFLSGVIEGFYGQPWSVEERIQLFKQMAQWGLNTYLYAPKDDLKHRAIWREPYDVVEAEKMAQLIRSCTGQGLRFIYALGPGLDIQYGNGVELEYVERRFQQLIELGCGDFALLFDDIPDRLDPRDLERWGSLASAQCHVTNAVFRWTRQRCPEGRFLFCPTPYCGRMAANKLGGENYLAIIGQQLVPEIDVFWTGPEIISQQIGAGHIRELRATLRRKPVIWDNLHANDYDGRRFFCGPYAGREPEIREEVNGLLSNPNNEFPLNYVPLRTLAEFVHNRDAWDSRASYLSAMGDWHAHFQTVTKPIVLEDFILFGDCYYLPHEEGPAAENLYREVKALLASDSPLSQARLIKCRAEITRLRDVCARISELRDRPLFYALGRRAWELREELDLLNGYLEFHGQDRSRDTECRSDFHLPGTFRGGMVARLQRLLTQRDDGTFVASPDCESPENATLENNEQPLPVP